MVNKRGSEFKKSAQQMFNKWNEMVGDESSCINVCMQMMYVNW